MLSRNGTLTEDIRIEEQRTFSPELQDAVQRLLNQLTTTPRRADEKLLRALLLSPDSHLFFLKQNDEVLGMATLGSYLSPTGPKTWVEDVVIDEKHRGKHLGKLFMEKLIALAGESAPGLLMLTSRPTRIAANRLYEKVGFERKETNVYKMNLPRETK